MRGDGHVVTWGHARDGGDSAAVQKRAVQHISSTVGAFATVRVVGGRGNLVKLVKRILYPPNTSLTILTSLTDVKWKSSLIWGGIAQQIGKRVSETRFPIFWPRPPPVWEDFQTLTTC